MKRSFQILFAIELIDDFSSKKKHLISQPTNFDTELNTSESTEDAKDAFRRRRERLHEMQ